MAFPLILLVQARPAGLRAATAPPTE
jgi:hypothetical protein